MFQRCYKALGSVYNVRESQLDIAFLARGKTVGKTLTGFYSLNIYALVSWEFDVKAMLCSGWCLEIVTYNHTLLCLWCGIGTCSRGVVSCNCEANTTTVLRNNTPTLRSSLENSIMKACDLT